MTANKLGILKGPQYVTEKIILVTNKIKQWVGTSN